MSRNKKNSDFSLCLGQILRGGGGGGGGGGGANR